MLQDSLDSLTRISTLPDTSAPHYLTARIIERVSFLRRRTAVIRACIFGSVSLISLTALMPVIQYASDEFYLSGFMDYINLFFSDHDVVLNSWREVSLTLLQSLPALPLALGCALVTLFIWSLSLGTRHISLALAHTA
jgi:hypothetical protein